MYLLTKNRINFLNLMYVLFLQVELYEIRLIPDLDPSSETAFTTEGSVTIHLKTDAALTSKRNTIPFHSKQMLIKEDSVEVTDNESNTKIAVDIHEYDLDREFYVLHLESNLTEDKTYTIKIDFTAVLNDDLDGFYRSSYFDEEGTYGN